MKKIIFTSICALALCAIPAQANPQTEEVNETAVVVEQQPKKSFWNGFFVSAGAGAQIMFGDHDVRDTFGARISPAFDVYVGKWFTPIFGLRLGVSGFNVKGATKWEVNPTGEDSAHGTGKTTDELNGHCLQRQAFNYANTHVDFLVNFSNLACSYCGPHVWNAIPYVGIGWVRSWSKNGAAPEFRPTHNDVSVNIGFLNAFRINEHLNINLDIHAMATRDKFDGEEGGRKIDGILGVTAGVSWTF